jgi:uncharacterized protein (DUF2062 family)
VPDKQTEPTQIAESERTSSKAEVALAALPQFFTKVSFKSYPHFPFEPIIGIMVALKPIEAIKRTAAPWLRQGISPQRLALTLALGIAIGCIPVMGVTTALCIVAAFVLRLNYPVIQVTNWAVMPLQLVLIVPFVRLGERLFSFGSGRAVDLSVLLHASPLVLISRLGSLTGQALLAWLLIAVPAVALMTAMLTPLLRRVPAVAEAGD